MLAKTLVAHTMRRVQKLFQHVQIATIPVYLTVFAPTVVSMEENRLFKRGQHNTYRIGIDVMGSDSSPEILLQVVVELAKELKDVARLFVFGSPNLVVPSEITLVPADEVIEMTDDPLVAIRRKKHSSLVLGMQMLKKKEIDALVSAGNTGALLAAAATMLPLLNSIDRPALMTLLPTKLKPMAVLDVGANIKVKPEHLVQFARLGIAYQKSRGVNEPKVGLLNIGTEEKKGSSELQEAYQKLQSLGADFLGNIEGRDAFLGHIDVLVTDGFTGNVFLKTAEGMADFIFDILEDTVPELEDLHQKFDYDEYPGAILSGVEGIVVKCHGVASQTALYKSVKAAIGLLENNFIGKTQAYLH